MHDNINICISPLSRKYTILKIKFFLILVLQPCMEHSRINETLVYDNNLCCHISVSTKMVNL